MIKLLIGGSPCTHWSIAQKNNRETKPEGIGWELFRNYLIAKEKFKPDLFLYENNKSVAQSIKNRISTELDAPLMYINSALVSAQNRQRFYAFNWKVDQPQDRGIVLADILQSGVSFLEKSYALTTRRIGTIESGAETRYDSKPFRVYSPYGKSVTLQGEAGGVGAKTGLYATPAIFQNPHGFNNGGIKYGKAPTMTAAGSYTSNNFVVDKAIATDKPIYEVRNGLIEIKGRQYPVKLPDGYYTIRKLTVAECCRLQTFPDDYCRAVSPTQAYRGLGNGWTAEVIIHILNGVLKNAPRDEEILCLSMYDGIGTGRYCLGKMGFRNVKYFAYEIDKFAIKVANSNFSDIIQCGDAFDLRRRDWKLGG